MRQIQSENIEAFSEFYLRYKSPLYTYFRGLVNEGVAEELLQETFIKAMTKKNHFRYESKVKTWLWSIAKNTLRDHWRTTDHKLRNSFDPLEEESGDEKFESPLQDAEKQIIERSTKQQLLACISELPTDQKEIVMLHIQSELSYQEIADLTQVSVGAIKSVLFRSKERLLECFRRRGHL